MPTQTGLSMFLTNVNVNVKCLPPNNPYSVIPCILPKTSPIEKT